MADRIGNEDGAPAGVAANAGAATDGVAAWQARLRRVRAPLLAACGVAFGVAVAAAWMSGRGQSAATEGGRQVVADTSRSDERLSALEEAARRLEASFARLAASGRGIEAEATSGRQQERFILAMLHLQASLGSARPWMREYEAAASFATPDALPRPVAEILASHAARGLATEADLRERFAGLAPTLVARAPRQGGVVEQTTTMMRATLAAVGLAAPPPPSTADVTVSGIQDHLRRGNLAAAVSDAAMLDPSLQPLIAGWMAQARARLAVEQAVQETLLRALGRAGHGR